MTIHPGESRSEGAYGRLSGQYRVKPAARCIACHSRFCDVRMIARIRALGISTARKTP
ncbi:MAG TPA: hypothetical protein VMZ32_05085 [Gammaproteobacteria bacterium]|nr:hypothetical protein [Gammaproteobacteria bacterium]